MNKRLENAQNYRESKGLIKDIFEKIRKVSYSDLLCDSSINGNNQDFTVSLPEDLMSDFNKVKDTIFDLAGERLLEIANIDVWGSYDEPIQNMEWGFSVSTFHNQRIHINGFGLPHSFRKLGLGKKIYKKILLKVGYISTQDEKSYKYSDFLWLSIVNDMDFISFISRDKIICCLSDNIPSNLVDVLAENFTNDAFSCSGNVDKLKENGMFDELIENESFHYQK